MPQCRMAGCCCVILGPAAADGALPLIHFWPCCNGDSALISLGRSGKLKCCIQKSARRLMTLLLCNGLGALKPLWCCRSSGCLKLLMGLVKLEDSSSAELGSAGHGPRGRHGKWAFAPSRKLTSVREVIPLNGLCFCPASFTGSPFGSSLQRARNRPLALPKCNSEELH